MAGEAAAIIALTNIALDIIESINKNSPENAITPENLAAKLADRQRGADDLAAKVDAS